jgi:RNA polymerase sigma-70 factor, ECF subfamily
MRKINGGPLADRDRIEEEEMSSANQDGINHLIEGVRAGREGALEELVRAIYAELRNIAGRMMGRERPGHTLQPTELVNEALCRMLEQATLADAPNRAYLFAAAAVAMRRILVEHARKRRSQKRGGNRVRVPLDEVLDGYEGQNVDVIALHEALERLVQEHPRQAQVVTYRFFGGLPVPEVAEVLRISVTTAESDWRFARAWLKGQLGGSER